MELAEDKRRQLDGIIQQMIQNKESDENVQTVVNDFKTKYTTSPERSIGGTILHGAGATASGFNKGVAETLGTPVDIANLGLGAVGLGSKEPVLGSQWIKKNIMPQEVKPEGVVENVLSSTANQIPSMLPGVGFASKVVPLTQAIKGASRVAIGSGIGSGLAKTIAPDSPYVDMAAQLIGGLTPSGIKGAIRLTSPKIERAMIEKAMKPSTVLKEPERIKRLETALNEGIVTTKKGLERSKTTIGAINDEIQQKINDLSAQGRTVNRQDVLAPAEAMKLTEMPKQAFPLKPTKQIESTISEFEKTHPPDFSIRKAQNFKQSINKELDDFYGALNHSPDKTAAIAKAWTNKTKAKIADGLREEISNIFPEVKDLNKRERALIQLNKSLEQAVNRISQHDIWSLRGVVSAVVHPKYAVMNYVLNNPTIQSHLAVAIRKARISPLNVAGIVGEGIKQAGDISRIQTSTLPPGISNP